MDTATTQATDPANPRGAARGGSGFRELVEELRQRLARAQAGGGEKARKRHTDRGKLLPRDRIRLLLDALEPTSR